ncbi:MAG: YitT family protein [Prevotella sp.]|nr:YitT family protein [Massilibacteroides sp.]MDD2601817.1 YitT family protein [Prevotella sp.]MDD3388326.1 YitT family protein [Prevotella sp.]MDD4533564.1 YitT family protein [Prevotella sp.]MDT3386159.1 YitT family protein [Bacteroidota bacterium]
MNIEKKKIVQEIRDYLMIAIGMISYCIGWILFLLPNEIPTGAVPGIASLLFWATGIPVQVTYLAINGLLLIAALKILGAKFMFKTIYAVAVLTLATTYVQTATMDVHLLQDQPFMASIIGAIFCGSGIGLGFAFHGSTGGTDIIAAIVNKYKDLSLGRVIMLLDIVIITCSYLVFQNWEKVIYGYVVLSVTSFCIDQVFQSMHRSVQFFIISDKYKEIASRIAVYPHRGATVLEAHGFHTGHEVKMLFVMAKRRESDIIFSIIREIDPKAFVTQNTVIGVYGEGFDQFKAAMPLRYRSNKLTPEQQALLGK